MSQSQNKPTLQAYREMFLTDGWKMLCDDFQKNIDSIGPSLMGGMPNIEYVYYEKGRSDVWKYVLGLESLIDRAEKAGELDE